MTGTCRLYGLSFTVCATLLVSIQESYGQKVSTLAGTVIDSVTRRPVADASIIFVGTTLGTSADSNGRFMIRRVPQGSHEILISHVAYVGVSQSVTIPADTATIILNVSLSPTVLPLPGVTAMGEIKRRQLAKDSSYRKWARVAVSAKQLEEECIIDFDQFLHRHAPLAEEEYELFVDGSRFPLDLRDIIKIHTIREIFIWRRINAPLEFKLHNQQVPEHVDDKPIATPGYESPRKRAVRLDPFIIKPYIILIETK